MPKLGIGTSTPYGNTELSYCGEESGLVVTKVSCGTAVSVDINDLNGDVEIVGPDDGVFISPFNFSTFNVSTPNIPLITTSRPLIWARTFAPGMFGQSDNYNSKFIVMPSGKTGINVANPRASLDVRGQGGRNLPVAIFGNRALGTASVNVNNGITQFYTQHLQIIPWLGENAYNQITREDDQGIFFTDGKGAEGANQNGSFIIAPWTDPGEAGLVGGLRIDKYGNLDVHGTIKAVETRIEAKWWSDFVFNEDYRLMSLSDVKEYIDQYGHLPNIPSEKVIFEEGIDVADMQARQLQKIEELTLYIINQEEQLKNQEVVVDEQQVRIEKLEQKLEEMMLILDQLNSSSTNR
ncbi:MAG: hypothetical protein WD077_00220 [Bacteroidia bacterium]